MMSIVEFTENLVKSIVKEPDMVKVQSFGGEDDATILEIIVADSDKGAVIGKNGRMANSLRTVVQAYAYLHDNKKIKLNIDSF
ncbi:MAG: KH domain-containing protein [Bacilli bacterium]|nr:KH domain-containing protein [Bacilli bacterium]